MQSEVIEVTPKAAGWSVTLRHRVRGIFADSAHAVAYACSLSDDLARAGENCRIRVRFSPLEPTLAD